MPYSVQPIYHHRQQKCSCSYWLHSVLIFPQCTTSTLFGGTEKWKPEIKKRQKAQNYRLKPKILTLTPHLRPHEPVTNLKSITLLFVTSTCDDTENIILNLPWKTTSTIPRQLSKLCLLRKITWYDQKLQIRYKSDLVVRFVRGVPVMFCNVHVRGEVQLILSKHHFGHIASLIPPL